MKRKMTYSKTKQAIMAALAVTAIALSSSPSFADTKAIIKHRQGVMEAIGGHFGATYASMRDMEQFAENRQFHAESVAKLAKIAAKTFPTGSGEGKTEALPAIWEKPERFQAAMDDFLLKADEFAAASTKDLGSLAAAAKALGQSCKGCHDDFRE